jgi:peptide/nickel transport system ATP-binding protein
MKLLEVENLHTYFNTIKGQLRAVNGVSFDLNYGEVLGLVGESGCGKTTCALSIARLLPKEGKIYGGEIRLEGTDLVHLSDDEIRSRRWKDVSIILQGAMNALNPVMKVGEQIAEALMLHEGLEKKEAMLRAGELFKLVEMPADRMYNYPHEFSGGMKQRAMIAMAVACRPKVVIGDEPTTALDVMVQAQILTLLEKLRRELNMGLILITHDLSILGATCDRIAVMYAERSWKQAALRIFSSVPLTPIQKGLSPASPTSERKRLSPPASMGSRPTCWSRFRDAGFIQDAIWRCPFALRLNHHRQSWAKNTMLPAIRSREASNELRLRGRGNRPQSIF